MAPTEYADVLREKRGQLVLVENHEGRKLPTFPLSEEEDAEIDAKRQELQEQIEQVLDVENERHERLQEVEEFFGKYIDELMDKIREVRERREHNAFELDLLENPPPTDPPPPGPKCLMFILSDVFNLIATIVIVSNITTMIMEMIMKGQHSEEINGLGPSDFFWLGQFYMSFYIFEIVVKMLLLQWSMVLGPLRIVWWNWLDLIIVVSGCIDMYLMPVLKSTGLMTASGSGLKALSFLRAMRLLRILKIVGMFLKSDLSFANGDAFQGFIMGVIGFNSVIMGLEIEIPAWTGWYYIEQALLVIFSFELLCRLKNFGCAFFTAPGDIVWNWLDFTIVMGGIVDQWLMPAIDTIKMLMGQKSGGKGNLGQVMMMLRMARLLRILRLVRLVKNIPPLFTLIVGIAQAMQGMMWVVVLTIVILYAFSLLGVKLIGQGLLLGPEPQEDVTGIFPNVFDSFFVLFKAMNGDWGSLEPLFEVLPASKGVLFLYTVMSTWGILSIMTAVVSDSMINSTAEQEAQEEDQTKKEEDERRERELTEIFEDIDHDDNGYVCKEEYEKMLVDVKLRERLLNSADLTKDEIKQLFSFLEEPHPQAAEKNILEPVIYKRTFVSGLKHNSRTVSERSVMRLENRIMRLELEMRAWGQQTLKDVLTHDATLQASQRVIAGDVSDFINDADREPPPENPYGTETTSLSRSRSANLKSPR